MDTTRDYLNMPIYKIEEIAYRLQIDYKPPLVEDDRDRVVSEILKLRDTYKDISEDDIINKWKKRRIEDNHVCHEDKTLVNSDNVNLKSDAQLVFMPDSLPNGDKIYYCFDRVTDVEYLLSTNKNDLNGKSLTPDQIEYLEKNKNNGYPDIHTGEFHIEAESIFGSSNTVAYVEKSYIAKIKTLETFFENIGLIYTSNTLYEFASKFTIDDYVLYLKHKPINQKLPDGISRDTASSTTLNHIINYIEIQIQQGNVNVVYDIAMTINEFYIMVRDKLTYEELFKGHAKVYANSDIVELKWKPDFLVEKYTDEILERYSVDTNGLKHGKYRKFSDVNLLYEIHYVHGIRNGMSTIFAENTHRAFDVDEYSNTPILRTCYYENGVLNGQVKLYFPNGEIKIESNWVNGVRQGKSYVYDEGKNIISTAVYENGVVIEGEEINDNVSRVVSYFDEYDNFESETNYVNDMMEGEQIEYYGRMEGDNSMTRSNNYHEDQLHGITLEYNHDGLIEKSITYANGEKEGEEIEYYTNSQNVKRRSNYHCGKRNGMMMKYEMNGKLISETLYVNDEKEGEEIVYYSNTGRIMSRANYHEGQLDGIVYAHFPDGHLKEKILYINGVMHERTKYYSNSDNVIKSIGNYMEDELNGILYKYDRDGHIVSEIYYVDHTMHGEGIIYYPNNGGINRKLNYSRGLLNGISYKYDTNGRIVSQTNYVNNTKQGQKIIYYSDNEELLVEFKLNYVDGILDGKQLNYHKDGRLKLKVKYSNGKMGVRTEYGYYEDNEHLIKSKYKSIDMQYHGLQLLYFRDGQIESELEYSNGIKHGRYVEYYPNEPESTLHRVKTLYNYCNGQYDGKQILYSVDGTINSEVEYSNGVRIK